MNDTIPSDALKGIRILLVDDEASLCDLLAECLTDFSAETVCAYSGPEALEKLDQGFHLVITDVRMPDMSGVELLASIKEKFSMPVLLVSGFADIEEAEAIGLGAVGLIGKPYEINNIVRIILKLAP